MDNNIIELDGYICKPVIYRVTPLNREICDVLLAVNRGNNKSDYIPCIAWGSNAQFVSSLEVPERLRIVGRIQSREYNKSIGLEVVTKRAYEVSIARLVDDWMIYKVKKREQNFALFLFFLYKKYVVSVMRCRIYFIQNRTNVWIVWRVLA